MVRIAVTMPGTLVTLWPTIGKIRPGALDVVKAAGGAGGRGGGSSRSGPPGHSPAGTVVPAVLVAFVTPEVKSTGVVVVSTSEPLRAAAVVLLRPGAARVSTLAVAP